MTSLPSIHGYTPADLQNMGMTTLFLLRDEPNLDTSRASPIQEPASSYVVPPSVGSAPLSLTPLRELPASVVEPFPVKLRKRRSKIARLPKDIQDNLNTMLADGRAYIEIIRCLNDQGYPGFNKVNLHDWKITGFLDWRHSRETEPIT